ncbi:LLM class flavin-dependent oxidoreductase [Sporichthya sp.]|uniref:LLM class flavin-dependent oxidoreductase n=1 Tax=Sporichthya sp. TaxID=65475 RepID=UPI001835F69C|nr:LLM class flavin-dependent oxidoreductase [Sporichthya sp.]MBA3741385.1 LLM class flavin-dependent oxidoreductase [Sporichthya sp.]
MALQFGLMNEIPSYPPYTEHESLKHIVDTAVLGEELGFDYFWTVEHHFLNEFSVSTAPESLLPYIAAKTSRMRIGHGVRLLPFAYNNPVRLAESAATLDLLCDGRLEFGTGRSISWDEMAGFGVNPEETRAQQQEALDIITTAWTQDVASYDGQFYKLPPRHVIPKPLQKPHPPLWGAATSPDSHRIAGENGLGLLSFTLLTPLDVLKVSIDLYRSGIASARAGQGNPKGAFINERVATFTLVHVAETDEEAMENMRGPAMKYIKESIGIINSVSRQVPYLNPNQDAAKMDIPSYDYLKPFIDVDLDSLNYEDIEASNMVMAGSPEKIITRIKEYEAMGVDVFLPMLSQTNMPHDKVMKSVELFGKHVIPAFR